MYNKNIEKFSPSNFNVKVLHLPYTLTDFYFLLIRHVRREVNWSQLSNSILTMNDDFKGTRKRASYFKVLSRQVP
jgi:hypothetical protein